MAGVSIENVVKKYGATEVIHGIDLEIGDGELTVLLGPSGCGKSTLLRMIAGLEDITDGVIAIDDRVVNNVDPSERGCAMVFQNYALYPHQTVYKNLAFPLKMAGSPKTEIDRAVRDTAATLQIGELLDRLPRDLSGGQRQRVAMGRAMIRNPSVFLFDEPLSNLDAELRVKMRLEISQLQESLGATVVFVTHDQVEAMTLAHRIVVMRDGRIEQTGTPLDVYRDPATRFVAGFLGSPSMNFIELEAVRSDSASAQIIFKGGIAVQVDRQVDAAASVLGVRPQEIAIADDKPLRPVTFPSGSFNSLGVEHLGDRAFQYVSTSIGDLAFMSDEGSAIDESADLVLELGGASLHLFDPQGRAVSGLAR